MKNLLRLFSVVVLVALMVSPFISTSSEAAKAQDDTFTIAWIPKALNNPVFELGRDGCMAAAAELSGSTGKTVECLYMGSVNSDAGRAGTRDRRRSIAGCRRYRRELQ